MNVVLAEKRKRFATLTADPNVWILKALMPRIGYILASIAFGIPLSVWKKTYTEGIKPQLHSEDVRVCEWTFGLIAFKHLGIARRVQ